MYLSKTKEVYNHHVRLNSYNVVFLHSIVIFCHSHKIILLKQKALQSYYNIGTLSIYSVKVNSLQVHIHVEAIPPVNKIPPVKTNPPVCFTYRWVLYQQVGFYLHGWNCFHMYVKTIPPVCKDKPTCM